MIIPKFLIQFRNSQFIILYSFFNSSGLSIYYRKKSNIDPTKLIKIPPIKLKTPLINKTIKIQNINNQKISVRKRRMTNKLIYSKDDFLKSGKLHDQFMKNYHCLFHIKPFKLIYLKHLMIKIGYR